MATIVITGATGFLGRFLTAHLIKNGKGRTTVVPVSRRALPGVCQVRDYSESPDGDILVHLAEEPNMSKVNQLGDPYTYDTSSVIRTLSRRFKHGTIYASSGAVYGGENEDPCRVDMPVVATDFYSKSKLINERIVLDSGGTIVRLSNLFGIGMSAHNVMSDIIRQVPGTGPLRIRDDKPVRDYLPVSEAATAVGLLIESNYCGIVNVGSGVGTSVRTLAELSLSLVGQEFREIQATEPSSRRSINVLDLSETMKVIDWIPTMSLKDQLAQLICKVKSAHE